MVEENGFELPVLIVLGEPSKRDVAHSLVESLFLRSALLVQTGDVALAIIKA